MKKFFAALLALTLLLSSCTNRGNDESGTNGDDSTLGDTDGDGMIETDAESESEVNFDSVEKVESADDAVNFIGANVYSRCRDVLPMYTETRILSKDDMDGITYNTGLTDVSGIDDIIISESGVSSIAYSFVMLRTDGTNTAEIQTALGESIDPAKWVCVSAEKVASVVLDDDIILVMGQSEQVDTIMNAVCEAGEEVYGSVGSVMSVLG